MNDVIVSEVSRVHDGRVTLKQLTHTFAAGSRTCVMGPSGCGKTTLLRSIAGLTKPDTGTVERSGRVSFAFQEERLIRHLSALENCTLVGIPKDKAENALTELGLENDMHKAAGKLSGGMARRVEIARAMLFDAETVLLDEPLKGLDSENYARTLAFIDKYSAGKTLIMVTHAENDAEKLQASVLRLT